VPNHPEFELSADIKAKADALSREIASINNNLRTPSKGSSKESGVFITEGTDRRWSNEDAALIPLTMFELRKERRREPCTWGTTT